MVGIINIIQGGIKMETLFKANFILHGEKDFKKKYWFTGRKIRKSMEQIYVMRRNDACDILNGKYEDWNNDFNRLYPDKDGWSKEYSRYICTKQNEILNAFNERYPHSLFELFSSEDCNICIRFKKHPNIWMDMTLIPYTK